MFSSEKFPTASGGSESEYPIVAPVGSMSSDGGLLKPLPGMMLASDWIKSSGA